MLRGRLSSLRRAPISYGAAVAFTILAFLTRLSLQEMLGERSPFLMFLFAVAITAIACGAGPAVLSTIGGLLLGLYVFVPPAYGFLPVSIGDVIQALTYLVPSGLIIALAHASERDRERLIREADRFRFLTSQARDYAIITMNPAGVIQTWSKGAEEIFGYTEAEARGQSGSIIFTEEDRAAKAPDQEMASARQQGQAPDERWHVRKDGSKFYGLGVLVALRDSTGAVVEFAKILRDGTHIKEREEQLARKAQRSERALIETTEHIDAFTYTVAHDLRAPLRAMDGYAKVLMEEFRGELGGEGRLYLSRILAAAHRMDELVSDLLEFWHLNRLGESCVYVDANAVLERVLMDLDPDIRSHRAVVKRETPLPIVQGHSECLYKAFCHLVGNALKFAGNGRPPNLRIGCEEHDGYVRLYFKDDGPGIPAEYHNRIFKVFERIQPDKPGTGIGLSIVHKCAELMRGRAGLESRPGQGSCFWIDLLPAKPKPAS